jgi:hypothetical protein
MTRASSVSPSLLRQPAPANGDSGHQLPWQNCRCACRYHLCHSFKSGDSPVPSQSTANALRRDFSLVPPTHTTSRCATLQSLLHPTILLSSQRHLVAQKHISGGKDRRDVKFAGFAITKLIASNHEAVVRAQDLLSTLDVSRFETIDNAPVIQMQMTVVEISLE